MLVKLQCENCGTQYKFENEQIIRVEKFQNPVKIYTSGMEVSKEMLSYDIEHSSEYCVKQLSHNLADAIASNMELTNEYNPLRNTYKMTARVRIVEPKYIF